MNIGYWLRQTKKKDIRQFWIEAYVCALQRSGRSLHRQKMDRL